MTKYLEEERFIVGARDPQAQKNYADNWERTFGDKSDEPEEKPCNVCGDLGHERVTMANGLTLKGCPEVPQGMRIPDSDAIQATLKSYANLVVQGPAASFPAEEPEYKCEHCGTCVEDLHGSGCPRSTDE
jgi:hypothetical protein